MRLTSAAPARDPRQVGRRAGACGARGRRIGSSAQEAGAVGDGADDRHAARRAALERQYDTLPAPGTAAYWRRIEQLEPHPAAGAPLDREVLARCVQERALVGHLADAHRVFTALVQRVQADVRRWARRCGAPARGALNHDLQQECYLALWAELSTEGRTFFTVHFGHALRRLQQRAGQELLIREGYRRKPGVEWPDRVPVAQRDSLELPTADDADDLALPLALRLVDVRALDPAVATELSDLVQLVTNLPPRDRTLIFSLFWRDETREVVAQRLRVKSVKTIYNRLYAISEQLRVQYSGGEEVTDGGAAR
jgi:DNA-directed RNA polymerase specialized sigma24 family protein